MAEAQSVSPVQLVDPTIGTSHCRWFFFTPGAKPFGMAKPGPCTDAHLGNLHGWEAVGYDSRHDSIESFVSFREFQIGGLAIMASSGPLKTVPGALNAPGEGYRSRFDKQDETATAGYYSVLLKDHDIFAELTATDRVAFHRFTFRSADEPHHIIVDVGNRQGESGPVLDAFVRRCGEREFEGSITTLPAYVKGYQPGATMRLYFFGQVDAAVETVGTFRGTHIFAQNDSIQGPGAGLYLKIAGDQKSTTLKVGLSYTSVENAKDNLRREAAELTFDQARSQAQQAWEEALSRIQIAGGKREDQVKFYTALYHALLGRGMASDANGAYPRNDGSVGQIPLDANGKPRYNHYNSDSLWGVFWNLSQLWALAYPEFLSEYVQTHLDIYRDCGWLPDSIAASKFVSGVGTGFGGVLVASAYAWGIRDFDTNQALSAVIKNELGWQNRPIGVGKADLKSFLDFGYVPYIERVPTFSAASADGAQFSASHTLEYSFSCAAAAQMAQSMGRTNELAILEKYGRAWENLFDQDTLFIRPKGTNGQFIADFDPKKAWIGFQEGNAWQYTFYVPHQVDKLLQKVGTNIFNERLDATFKQAEKTIFGGGQKLDAFSGLETTYNHGNQPSLHISWLFTYGGRPWLTQHWVRRICDEFYGTNRTHGYGYGQDEDQGQLGAWYVLAAIGLFDVQGGTGAQPAMQMATPLFNRIEVALNPKYYSGTNLTISVSNPAAPYIATAAWNGMLLPAHSIPWKSLTSGGNLKITTTSEVPRH